MNLARRASSVQPNGARWNCQIYASGPGGTAVTVRGTGFSVGETVCIAIPGPTGETNRLGTATAGRNRSFIATVTIPQEVAPEQITIVAFSESVSLFTGVPAPEAMFTVTAAGAPHSAPRVAATPTGSAALPRTGAAMSADSRPVVAGAGIHPLGFAVAAGLVVFVRHICVLRR